ncbi:MAG TPA: hypothetical protein VJB39_03360 [Patescibacteria group bacterium]|nr:hypothetical protein [Patescibacteria group bacterium]
MINRRVKKIYRAKLDDGRSKIVGWPRFYHAPQRRTLWQSIRAMLF